MTDQNEIDYPFMEIIRNYPNQVFRLKSDYDAAKRALLKEDLQFLREDFTGHADEMCLALQQYVTAFQAREEANETLYDYMEYIGDAGISYAYWDPENRTMIRPPLTEEQQYVKELVAESQHCHTEQRRTRTDVLHLMYGDRDDRHDEEIYGWGVYDEE